MEYTNGVVVVLNPTLTLSQSLQVITKLSVGLGARLSPQALQLDNFVDASGDTHPDITEMPITIMSGDSHHIAALIAQAQTANYSYVDMVDTMLHDSIFDQHEYTRTLEPQALNYCGVAIFGVQHQLQQLVKGLLPFEARTYQPADVM